MEDRFKKIEEIAEERLKDCSAHSIEHVKRVYSLCLKLAENQEVDLGVLRVAALLHDIGGKVELNDLTGNTDHAFVGAEMVSPILKNLNFSDKEIKHIQDCILSHRYKNEHEPKTIEAKILFDADKLDSIGAIGIARAFVWIGGNKANIYSKPDIEEYAQKNLLGGKISGRIKDKSLHSPQIEFATKIKFLKDKLYTEKGKEIAEERTTFFKDFLDRLEMEVKGEIQLKNN